MDEKILILRECEEITASTLAKEVDVSPHALMCDLNLLRKRVAQLKKRCRSRKWHSLERTIGYWPINTQLRRSLRIVIGHQCDRPIRFAYIINPFKVILKKLASSFPQSYRNKIRGLRNRILAGVAASFIVTKSYLQGFKAKLSETIQKGFFDPKLIELKYADNKKVNTVQEVEVQYGIY